jgi:DNA-binding response OmpR family regulator
VAARAHVLVVEDNELVSSALRILLESEAQRVSTAQSIADALAVGVPNEDGVGASLVLLDLTLPDGDGLSLVDPLPAARWDKIVALTGHDDPETRRRCLDAGCIDVLLKPVPARELVEKCTVWLAS